MDRRDVIKGIHEGRRSMKVQPDKNGKKGIKGCQKTRK